MHIVLDQPQIPQNTGNIARTCAVTGAKLHLIKPMGFTIDDAKLKRAGLDYWHMLGVEIHESITAFYAGCPKDARLFYLTTKAPRDYTSVSYRPNDYLVFGKETAGLDEAMLRQHLDFCIRIPMVSDARSLNLSNSVAIVLYEALRQQNFPGLMGQGKLGEG